MGGFGIACTAIEALTMNLAGELGPRGIRVVCLRPEGIPETWREYTEEAKQFAALKEFHELLKARTLLGRLPTLAEVANAAAFMASDRAGAITAAVINLTCGSIAD